NRNHVTALHADTRRQPRHDSCELSAEGLPSSAITRGNGPIGSKCAKFLRRFLLHRLPKAFVRVTSVSKGTPKISSLCNFLQCDMYEQPSLPPMGALPTPYSSSGQANLMFNVEPG